LDKVIILILEDKSVHPDYMYICIAGRESSNTGKSILIAFKDLATNQIKLKKILNDLNQTIQARQEEGAISSLDASLISMSTFGVKADILQTQREFRQAMKNFKKILGMESMDQPGTEIQAPMSIVILGGLITATFLNMIVIPVLFEQWGVTKNRINT